MSTRKIRLSFSGSKIDDLGPLIDIDFNNENLDMDVEVDAVWGESVLIKEYTVDVKDGKYELEITYKNDEAVDTDGDGEYDENRFLVIEKIEYSNNGTDYLPLAVHEDNTSLTEWLNFDHMGYRRLTEPNPEFDATQPETWPENFPDLFPVNPDFDQSLPRTDDKSVDYIPGRHPGNNPMGVYELIINPIRIWKNKTATFTIDFT